MAPSLSAHFITMEKSGARDLKGHCSVLFILCQVDISDLSNFSKSCITNFSKVIIVGSGLPESNEDFYTGIKSIVFSTSRNYSSPPPF